MVRLYKRKASFAFLSVFTYSEIVKIFILNTGLFLMLTFVMFASLAIDIYIWIMIIGIIMGWLIAFNVLNGSNTYVQKAYILINRVIDPVLAPIRKIIPALGGIDISPIVVIIGAQLLQRSLYSLL